MKIGTLLVAAIVAISLGAGKAEAAAGDLGNARKALTNMNRAQIDYTKKCYLDCLESSNDGVVQSAIGIVLQWRLINPEEDLSMCQAKINELAVTGGSPTVRFKASLASLVMDNPSLVDFDVAACDDCGQLFDEVTASVRQMVVGYRSH